MSTQVADTCTCPHCGAQVEVPLAAVNNCQRYFSQPVFRARCCGYGIRLVPHFSVTFEAAERNKASDSFGLSLNTDD